MGRWAGGGIALVVLLAGCGAGVVHGDGRALLATNAGSPPSTSPVARSASPGPATTSAHAPSSTSPALAYQRLPGYGTTVSTADVGRLTAAAGMLETRVNGATDPKFWTPICNGTLVSINGMLRVMTAAHCLDYSEGHPSSYAQPTDVTSGLLYQYGFRRYASDKAAVVLQKAAVAGSADVALFSILPTDPNIAQLPATAAIPFTNPDTTLAGTQVDLATEPGSQGISTAAVNPEDGSGSAVAGPRLTTSRIYLGRIHDPSSGRLVDLWGDDVAVPNHDSCYFGGSGSSAVGAGGWVTGPMTFRDYLGTASAQDDAEDSLAGRKAWRTAADQMLGFDTTNFVTVCSTAAISAETLSQVAALL